MKISNNAPVTLGFAFVSFVQILVASLTHGAGTSLFVSPHTFDFFSIQSWFASVLHVVGHANFEHFSGNILFIMLLGPMVEEKYGSTQLLFMIIGTAIATSVVNSLLLSGSIIGASGVVFMMILLSSFTNVSQGTIPATFIVTAVLYIGKESISMLAPDNVSHFAHIIGGLVGAIGGFILPHKK